MRIVVDANIIFASMIGRGYAYLILLRKELEIYTPEFAFEEVNNYKEYILEKSGLSEQDYNELLQILRNKIKIFDDAELMEFYQASSKTSPDPDDKMYFALALKLDIPIWSNDKELKKQKKVKIYTTEELMEKIR